MNGEVITAGTRELLSVLAVDDSTVNRQLMSAMLRKMGHIATMAADGMTALALCEQKMPDLVLMDVQLPAMNGFDTVREMRRRYEAWFPILFLSAQTANSEVLEGLRAGGDDYLFKPVNYEILQAKIQQFQIRLEQNKRLVEYRARIEEETVTARAFIEQFTALDKISDPWVRFLLKPAESYSGDLIAFARAPDGRLHVLLADSAGHGLTAALAVIPITQPFYQMTAKGFDIAAILLELNRRVREYLPLPGFVATAILSITPDTGVVEVWNGGLPPVLVLGQDGVQTLHSFKSRHLPLGVVRGAEFDAGMEYYNLAEQPVTVFLCSDGATEINVGDNQLLGQSGLLQEARRTPSVPLFDSVLGVIDNYLAGVPPTDDIALIMIDCQPLVAVDHQHFGPALKKLNAESAEEVRNQAVVATWDFSLLLTAQHLKNLDVVPFLLGIVRQIENGKIDSRLFLVLSELFNNALDHGVLKLDSSLKEHSEGMEHYFAERSRRLADLKTGEISLHLEKLNCKSWSCLRVSVKDSGDGFDFTSKRPANLKVNQQRHGRGIALLESICERLEYFGCGSEVVAYFDVSASEVISADAGNADSA